MTEVVYKLMKKWQPYCTDESGVNRAEEEMAKDILYVINTSITEYLQDKLNNYDVGSLEFKIIKGLINE